MKRPLALALLLAPLALAAPPPTPPGFFAKLRQRLDRDPATPPPAEKPPRPANWPDLWVVTDDDAPFYEFGPSQSTGPDRRLPRGLIVKRTQANRGWSRIQILDGPQGYLGSDQLRPASPADFSDPLPPPIPAQSSLPGTPFPPPQDLPDLPSAPGPSDSFLLPPLEFEGTELKQSSLRQRPSPAPPLPSAAP